MITSFRILSIPLFFLIISSGCVDQHGTDGRIVNASIASSPVESYASTTSSVTGSAMSSPTTRPATLTSSATGETTVKTSSQTPGVTYASNLSIGDSCDFSEECASDCCKRTDAEKKCMEAEYCKPKQVSEDECYLQGKYWCAGSCQKDECRNCNTYLRCVNVIEGGVNKTRVESAGPIDGRPGSCRYNGKYTDAGGAGGYCDTYKGTLVYARCGASPTWEDCAAVYQGSKGTYEIARQRAFHSIDGDEYDLWCFKCNRVG